MASTKKEAPGQQLPKQQQQGSKLYSKMLSKDAALAVPSFRVYYGVASAGSVPFLWESQPGTPKSSPSAAGALQPPLTPPPSYYAAGGSKKGRGGGGSASLSGTRWLAFLRRKHRTSPCSSSASWSSSSTASMSPVFTVQSSPAQRGHRRAFSVSDEEAARCFGMESTECERRGCGVAVAVRNALATVVGHKPGRRATSAAA